VADALAAGEQAVVKLLYLHAAVTLYVFKPLGRVARRVLNLQHLDAAPRRIRLQYSIHRFTINYVAAPAIFYWARDRFRIKKQFEFVGQVNRIFQRQLGA
jgi:hypothetical protein